MKRPNELEKDVQSTSTLVQLTSVFESLASMQIAKVKNEVLQSQQFFDKLWQIYTQIRVDSIFHFGRRLNQGQVSEKELFIVITAEGGFSGDIDQKLIKWMLGKFNKDKNDIIVVGHHGAVQLAQNGVGYKRYFKLPSKDKNINVAPIIKEVQSYATTKVFYQQYVSLMVQDVKSISLSGMVEEKGGGVGKSDEIISEETYIFEPSTFEVIDHLERTMLQIALSQVILESKLAQYASRFRAMGAAHQRADESHADFVLQYNRAKRAVKDERLREIINGLKLSRGAV
ncbi:F0F1 ATP synthase subunit gamma [Candidatus Saccharibacteria bacterium]|nr:F0F1 ATP synthase subunit gamma [Candidatus Saccharibacteria bacterium]